MGRAGRPGRLGGRAGERERTVAGVAAECLAALEVAAPALVVDDHTRLVEETLSGATELSCWRRWAYEGCHHVAAAPPPGPFATVTVRLPRDWPSFELQAHLIAGRLVRDGRLYVYGANDEGIRSAPGRLEPLFERVRTLETKRRTRVLEATRPRRDIARCDLESWEERLDLELPVGEDRPLRTSLLTYPGVFAAGRLDEGSACLIAALGQVALGETLLDFGCGHGVIARAARELAPDIVPTLLDVDALALEAARANLPGAETVLSDGWEALARDRRFDLIVSNPPIHRGRDEDMRVLEALVGEAGARLTARGALVTVTQRTLGVGRLFRAAFRKADLLVENERFQVWRGRRPG